MASPEPTELTLQPPEGGQPVRVVWDRAAAETAASGDTSSGPTSPWRFGPDIDWGHARELRLVSAVFEDGRALAVAAMRHREAQGHDQDAIDQRLLEGDRAVDLRQALLSVEYDADGLPRRLGLELWDEPESPPLRIAADRSGDIAGDSDPVRRQLARMDFRLDGKRGAGIFEVVLPG